MINCPVCGTPNTGLECIRCGTPLSDATIIDKTVDASSRPSDPAAAPYWGAVQTPPPASSSAPAWGTSAPWAAQPASSQPASGQPASTAQPYQQSYQPATPPTQPSQPQFTPPYVATTPSGGGGSRGLLLAAIAAVVTVIAIGGGVLVYRTLTARPDATPATAAAPSTVHVTVQSSSTTTQAPAPAPVPAPASTTTVVQPVLPPQPAPQTTNGGALVASPSSGWVVVLESLRKELWTVAQVRALADTMARGPRMFVVDSDATSGMNPGYYVIGDGGYADEASANAVCATYGRPVGGDCYAKPVTFSSGSAKSGPYSVETAAQECALRSPGAVSPCTASYAFMQRYAATQNSLTASTVGGWWADPADYFGETLGAADLASRVAAPPPAGRQYLTKHLVGYATSGSDVLVTLLSPRRDQGVLTISTVTYRLRPASDNGYRIVSASSA